MVQKRSIKTDDVRTEEYMALSDKAVRLLLDLKTNATDSYGFITNTALSLLVCSRGGAEMQQAKDALQELVDAKYLYDFGKGIYLVMSFQRDNALEYLKTTQPTAPELLTYVYVDANTNMYKLSATPVRSKDGWTGKITTNQNKNYQGKDNVPPRKYLFEDNVEDGYNIVPFDTSLDWSQHESVAKEVKQTPSTKDTTTVQAEPQEVAPAPQATKQVDKVNEELSRLDDEQEQDNDFETKMKEAHEKGQEAREDTPQSQEQPVNPYITTEDGQQQREALDQEYKQDQQQDINPDDIENLVAGAQTRSMPDTQTVESTNSNDTDQKLTADGLPDFLDNEADKADKAEEEEKQARYKEQGLNEFGYTDMRDTSGLPF